MSYSLARRICFVWAPSCSWSPIKNDPKKFHVQDTSSCSWPSSSYSWSMHLLGLEFELSWYCFLLCDAKNIKRNRLCSNASPRLPTSACESCMCNIWFSIGLCRWTVTRQLWEHNIVIRSSSMGAHPSMVPSSKITCQSRRRAITSRVGSAAGPHQCHATDASSPALAVTVIDAPQLGVSQVLAMELGGRQEGHRYSATAEGPPRTTRRKRNKLKRSERISK